MRSKKRSFSWLVTTPSSSSNALEAFSLPIFEQNAANSASDPSGLTAVWSKTTAVGLGNDSIRTSTMPSPRFTVYAWR